jgi:hypothetical protein
MKKRSIPVKYSVGRDVDLDKTKVLDKRGRRITEKRAESLAEEVIETYFKNITS